MDIFEKIENFSYGIGNRIGEGESEEYKELYGYSVFMITSFLFEQLIGVSLSIIFGYFPTYLIVTTSFILLRRGGGGPHDETFEMCCIMSNLDMMIASVTAIVLSRYYIVLFAISFICGIWILPYCPKPSKNSPSRGYHEDIRFRKIYRNVLVSLEAISLLFIYFGLNLYSASVSSGIIITVFVISDLRENIINILKPI